MTDTPDIDPAADYAEQVEAGLKLQEAEVHALDVMTEALAGNETAQAMIASDPMIQHSLGYYSQIVLPAMIVSLGGTLLEGEEVDDFVKPVTVMVIEHTLGAATAAAMAQQMVANLTELSTAAEAQAQESTDQ